jgi:hypothetical protein
MNYIKNIIYLIYALIHHALNIIRSVNDNDNKLLALTIHFISANYIN